MARFRIIAISVVLFVVLVVVGLLGRPRYMLYEAKIEAERMKIISEALDKYPAYLEYLRAKRGD